MKKALILLPATLTLSLTGCHEGVFDNISPIASAVASWPAEDGKRIEHSLSPQQLQALTTWLESSRSKWGKCLQTPPGGPVRVSIVHADGSTSSLMILKYPSGTSNTIQASHRDTPCALASFADAEILALRTLLGVPQ
ncbi:MAG TPA: hypothetical protein VLC92_02130 [Rhodocyclaceae bacterium]|nr:hypothetical protein [Rhodocyclaceae bacterium]